MANLKSLKIRINSIKSTQKITKAMQMVSASKFHRAKEKEIAAKPFANNMHKMVNTLYHSLHKNEYSFPLLEGREKHDICLLVIVTSDRGLCGPFNSSLIKEAKLQIEKLENDSKIVKIICIGSKGFVQLKRKHQSKIIKVYEDITSKNINFHDTEIIASDIINLFEKEEFDVCKILYNSFQSILVQSPHLMQLIPAEKIDPVNIEQIKYDFEPSKKAILEDLLPQNITMQILYALLDSSASEHAARMRAMENATNNAKDMIKRLTLLYNRSRQANITKELIEIISGAEAL
jgi:F-type H+-transporting ATPase subunit gamma